jgi:hypothetical protein
MIGPASQPQNVTRFGTDPPAAHSSRPRGLAMGLHRHSTHQDTNRTNGGRSRTTTTTLHAYIPGRATSAATTEQHEPHRRQTRRCTTGIVRGLPPPRKPLEDWGRTPRATQHNPKRDMPVHAPCRPCPLLLLYGRSLWVTSRSELALDGRQRQAGDRRPQYRRTAAESHYKHGACLRCRNRRLKSTAADRPQASIHIYIQTIISINGHTTTRRSTLVSDHGGSNQHFSSPYYKLRSIRESRCKSFICTRGMPIIENTHMRPSAAPTQQK